MSKNKIKPGAQTSTEAAIEEEHTAHVEAASEECDARNTGVSFLPLETFPPQPPRVAVDNVPAHKVRGDEIGITADGSARAEDIATPERTGADVIAELSAARLRIELAQVQWDALADELGQRAKKQHATRKAVRIGGSLYRFKFTEATKVYSLVPAADPTEIA